MIGVIKLMRKIRYKREDFGARMKMERDAQDDTAARLRRLELAYRNKTRMR